MACGPPLIYLIFDTETTGIPRNWQAPSSDTSNWPRAVQLAWASHGADGGLLGRESHVIRPSGFPIPPEAARVLVAHNLRFDAAVVGAEFWRLERRDPLAGRAGVCTMASSVEYCGLPGPRGLKWPRLEELHTRLFGMAPDKTHDAGADVATCARCFFQLVARGVVRVSRPARGVAGS